MDFKNILFKELKKRYTIQWNFHKFVIKNVIVLLQFVMFFSYFLKYQ